MPFARLLLYLTTSAALGLVGYALFVQPPPLWLSLSALTAYVTLVTLGILFSGFSMFADVVTEGPDNARGVALTFDDGPDPATTPQILELLEAAGATATFFVIGRKAERHPSLIRAIAKAGHAVGVHSYSHDRLFALRGPKTVRDDIARATKVLRDILGEPPTLFRAPIGHISPAIGHAVAEAGLQAIGWSVRGYDGRAGATGEKVAARVISGLRDGAIVLLHDASERADFQPASLDALPRILAMMEQKNLHYVRVDHWLGEGSETAIAAAHEQTDQHRDEATTNDSARSLIAASEHPLADESSDYVDIDDDDNLEVGS